MLAQNRFILFLDGLSRSIRFFITCSFLCLVFLSWLIFFYSPLSSAVQKKRKLISSLLEQNINYKKVLGSFEKINHEHALLKKELDSFFSKNKSVQVTLNELLSYIRKNNLKCTYLKPTKFKQKDFYDKNYFELKVSGDFENIMYFLNQVFDQMINLKIKEIKMCSNDKENISFTTKFRVISL